LYFAIKSQNFHPGNKTKVAAKVNLATKTLKQCAEKVYLQFPSDPNTQLDSSERALKHLNNLGL